MGESEKTGEQDDPFNLARFTSAQEPVYRTVLSELNSGRKRTHWMWYIFPQIEGLGRSETSRRYAIQGRQEAQAYLSDPLLGSRLRECAAAVLAVTGRSALEIFGSPDDVKLLSSMTLFAQIDTPDSVFLQVLAKYFHGRQDAATLRLLSITLAAAPQLVSGNQEQAD